MTATDTYPSLATALADLPPKIRVHELAKRAGVGSKEMIAALAAAGFTVRSASSSLERDAAVAVLTSLLGTDEAGGKEAPSETPSSDTERGGAEPVAAELPGAEATGAELTGTEPSDVDSSGTGPSAEGSRPARRRRGRGGRGRGRSGTDSTVSPVEADTEISEVVADEVRSDAADTNVPATGEVEDRAGGPSDATDEGEEAPTDEARRRRRRGRRGRGRPDSVESQRSEGEAPGPDRSGPDAVTYTSAAVPETATGQDEPSDQGPADSGGTSEGDDGREEAGSASARRRRRRRRGSGSGDTTPGADDPDDTVVHVREPRSATADVLGVKGSTRLEAKRQRRKDTRDSRRRPQILSEAEFLARRESVERVMAVRQRGDLAQVALLEDGVVVEHFVSRTGSESMIGNVYLGKVQNVLPSMEAAFVDIGRGRNAVLYAGEVNWDMAGLVGKARRIETALSSGDTVLVQVSKDPVGHKGARLTSQISLPGRFLVYVPGGGATGISRKLPDTERRRLKAILDKIVPEGAGVIIRTAAEGVEEAELVRDVERLRSQWEQIEAASTKKSSAPSQLYAEPGTLIKVIRDLFNSDINSLVVDGDEAWSEVSEYVLGVAPELGDRVGRYVGDGDVFGFYRVDEQIAKALERKVHLPSGGSLVIDRTEAMTVVDVNTGRFTGSGGNLEETVTRNNLEAAEEIVRQLRLRDVGGIIVIDFIDMVLESNRELVLRRLTECLGRDRTRHQVAEVTSLGLVQMTRKRMGIGLIEAFSEPCPHCGGRGIVLHDAPVAGASNGTEGADGAAFGATERRNRRRGRAGADAPVKVEPLVVERVESDARPDPRGPRPPAAFRAEATAGLAVVDVVVAEPEAPVRTPEPSDTESAASSAGPEVGPAVIDTAPPRRRRRAAGRPAGAPTAITEVLDLVIPGAPVASTEPTQTPDRPPVDAGGEAAGGAASGDTPAGDGDGVGSETVSRRSGGSGSRSRRTTKQSRRSSVSPDAHATNGSADAPVGGDTADGGAAREPRADAMVGAGADGAPSDGAASTGSASDGAAASGKRPRSRRGR
jgi:ribonuclease E